MADPTLYVKSTAVLDGLAPGGARILAVIAVAPLILGHDVTITSARDSHAAADSHMLGKAIDVRTVNRTAAEVLAMYKYFAQQLGDLFTVLYEVPIHERAALDPTVADLVYAPSDPDEQHLHCQVKLGRDFTAAARSV